MKPAIFNSSSSSNSNKIRNFYFDNSEMKLNADGLNPFAPKEYYPQISDLYLTKFHGGTIFEYKSNLYIANLVINNSVTSFIYIYKKYRNSTSEVWSNPEGDYRFRLENSLMQIFSNNNKLYAFGGFDTTTLEDSQKFYEFNMETSTTIEKKNLLPIKKASKCISVNNIIYNIGTNSQTLKLEISSYSLNDNAWNLKLEIDSINISNPSLTSVGNKIYIVGSEKNSPLVEYDTVSNTHVSRNNVPPFSNFQIFSTKTELFGFLSLDNSANKSLSQTNSIYKYDFTNNLWILTKSFADNSKRSYPLVKLFNNELIITGGINTSSGSNFVEYGDTEVLKYMPESSIILDYVEVGESVFANSQCKVNDVLIQPNTLTKITKAGYLYYINSENILSGYIEKGV